MKNNRKKEYILESIYTQNPSSSEKDGAGAVAGTCLEDLAFCYNMTFEPSKFDELNFEKTITDSVAAGAGSNIGNDEFKN
jgi:hypothetical protein